MSPRRNALAEPYRTQKCRVNREADRGLRMEFSASGELNTRLEPLLPQGYSRVGTQWPAEGMRRRRRRSLGDLHRD